MYMEMIKMADQELVQVRVDNDLKMGRGICADHVTRMEGLNAFEELRKQASDVPEMSLDEINEEIRLAREERKRREV